MSENQKKKKGSLRRSLIVLGIFLLCVILFLLSIPSLLSTKAGNRLVVAKLSGRLPGELSIERIRLSWFHPQHFENIHYRNPQKTIHADINEVRIDEGLIAIYFSPHPKPVWIDEPNLNIKLRGDEHTSPIPLFALSAFDLTIHKGHILLEEAPHTTTLTLQELLWHPNQNFQALELLAKGSTTLHGKTGNFHLGGKLESITNESLFSSARIRSIKKMEFLPVLSGLQSDMKLDIKDFPTRLLDLFTSKDKGIDPSDLLGEAFSLNGQLLQKQTMGDAKIRLHSNAFDLTSSGTLQNKEYRLTTPTQIALHITPALSQEAFKKTKLYLTSNSASSRIHIQIPHLKAHIDLVNPRLKSALPIINVQLGNLIARNEGNLTAILDLLKLRIPSHRDLPIRIGDSQLSLEGGILTLPKTPILIDNAYKLITWGRIDYNQDNLKIKIGITKEALQKAFGLKKVPDHEMIELRFEGPVDNPKLDTSKAKKQILKLVMQETGVLPF